MKVVSAGRYDVKIDKDWREWVTIRATATAGPVIGTFEVNVHADGRVSVRDHEETVNVQRHADKPGFDVSLMYRKVGGAWELDYRNTSCVVRKSYHECGDFMTMAPKTY